MEQELTMQQNIQFNTFIHYDYLLMMLKIIEP